MKSQLREHLWYSRIGFALSLGLLSLLTGCSISSTPAKPTASSTPALSPVSVAINPLTATLRPGGSLSLVATVKGAASTSVTWSVQEGATGGSITSSGGYTASNSLGTYHVIATSVADATASASAIITIDPPATPTATGEFTTVGSFAMSSSVFSSTLLPDGRVLIVGDAQSGPTAGLYSPPTGIFQASSANIIGTPVLLNTGEVLVVDAYTPELYDPKTDATTPTGHMLVNQGIEDVTALTNGKVLVLGTQDAEIYDPTTGSFASVGPYAAAMGKFLMPTIALADGRALVLSSGQPQLFDPATNTFSLTGSLSNTGVYAMDLSTATLLKDGRVLITGGMSDWRTAAAALYDPKTGTFAATGSMNAARDAHAAVLLADGRVLVLGGDGWACSGSSCYFTGSLSSAELYDPETGTFSRTGSMNEARTGPNAILLENGDVLVSGGVGYCGIGCFTGPTKTVEIYHP